ncbi:MAG: hypothetical protein FWC70_07610 [Defluviitaleaceae bacterium]|nr:hypothetical protein [Defluviitaleaceae bacterium]
MTATIRQALDLLQGFSEKEQKFALNVLMQIPERNIDENSYVCDYGYVHGVPNAETIAAIEETEEMIKKIETGEHVPRYSSFAELLAEVDAEIEAENNAKVAV